VIELADSQELDFRKGTAFMAELVYIFTLFLHRFTSLAVTEIVHPWQVFHHPISAMVESIRADLSLNR
jgi:hypothetical protein